LKERSQKEIDELRQKNQKQLQQTLSRKEPLADLIRAQEIHISLLENEGVLMKESLALAKEELKKV
jgi:hypothetical protein